MNKHFFYPRLAFSRLLKNRATYLPYFMVCTLSVVMFYCLLATGENPDLANMLGAASLSIIFGLGTAIIGIFAAILFIYTNSFLMKRRQKEFGLFNILGMQKKHIARMLFYENLYVSALSIASGLLLGILLSRLLFLLLSKILRAEIPLGFHVSPTVIGTTALLFFGLFLFIFVINLFRIHLSKPIELLRGGQTGEKEPKASWILTILGILALGYGYYIAITTQSPLKALYMFFLAVFLVILGTYFLFLSGSIAFLKFLKKRKNFYYRPKNFATVSGMLHRMKQNATGLASICILSTMVLVTLSSTALLYRSSAEVARNQAPFDINIGYHRGQGTEFGAKLIARLESLRADSDTDEEQGDSAPLDAFRGIGINDLHTFRAMENMLRLDGTVFQSENNLMYVTPDESFVYLNILPLEDVNRVENLNLTLEDGEAFLFTEDTGFHPTEITVNGHTLRIRDKAERFTLLEQQAQSFVTGYNLVVKDMATLYELFEMTPEDGESIVYTQIRFNLSGLESDSEHIAFLEALRTEERALSSSENLSPWISSYHDIKRDTEQMTGSFFFLGIFLGVIFLSATALIIYYKQISEGHQDHERFQIMQKVGMSTKEVRQTINKQILMVFFLPLLTAVIHIAFASRVLWRLLALFGVLDFGFVLTGIAGTILVFAVVYALIYKGTARAYYKLVTWKS